MNKLSEKDLRGFISLLKNETTYLRVFGAEGKRLISKLEAEGVIKLKRAASNSRELFLLNEDALLHEFKSKYHFEDIYQYYESISNSMDRAELAASGISTKEKSTNPKSGLHINSFDNVELLINNKTIALDLPDKCALFVHRSSEIKINPHVLIVGVENFDNITHTLSQKNLFNKEKAIIFVERSKYLQALLKVIPNEYLHFGDFDLAGIFIYQTQYKEITKGRGSFFIPRSVESDIKEKGITNLYATHLEKYGEIRDDNVELQKLINLIKNTEKTLEQEFYI